MWQLGNNIRAQQGAQIITKRKSFEKLLKSCPDHWIHIPCVCLPV